MKQLNKSPYEIRLELLQLAFQILIKKNDFADTIIKLPVSSEDVIKEAEKLNSFVSKATQINNP